jgi:heme exporter protein C
MGVGLTTALSRAQRVLGVMALVGLPAALFAAFVYAPEEVTMGPVQRIFYFHVASAWTAFLLFFAVFCASIAYLRRREPVANSAACAAAELGVVFTSLALISGSLWARPVWNTWWTWDPRLTTTLILWFTYVAYLLIQAGSEGRERQLRFAAVFGIVGFADIPLIFVSTTLWRSIHPMVISGGKMQMPPEMVHALIMAVTAFTILALFLLAQRLQLILLTQRLADLREQLKSQEV